MRHISSVVVLAAALAAVAPGCGDDTPKTPATTAPQVRTGTRAAAGAPAAGAPAAEPSGEPASGSGPATDGRPRAAQPLETPLPDAPPLVADAAHRVLIDAIDAAADPVVVREALAALATTAGADAVRAASAKLLTKGGTVGGYEDPESAAAALAALSAAGDADAAAKSIALARAGIEADLVFESFVPMLAAVKGPLQPDARALLVRLTEDAIVYAEAIEALAAAREPTAAERFHEVATDPEEEGGVRAMAAAGLLAIGDRRAAAVVESLVKATESELVSFDVMDGLAIRGVGESLPWIHKIADPVIAEGENCTVEIASLAAAYVDIRGAGKGTPEDLAALGKLVGADDGLSDDEVLTALWMLGDDKRADAAANVLARQVVGVSNFDEDLGVRLLDAVAARKAAAKRPFNRVVAAAAALAVPDDPNHPEVATRAWRIRVAAARAHLASR